jgi:anti-sigma factor RsiW
MRHPGPGELLELHFGELDEPLRKAAEAHVRPCAACAAFVAELQWVEQALLAGPGDVPPADGLQKVLARIEAVRPARERKAHWLRAAAPSAAALVAGCVAVHQGGLVAALAFFALGSIVTLAVAPVLILESQRRSS